MLNWPEIKKIQIVYVGEHIYLSVYNVCKRNSNSFE